VVHVYVLKIKEVITLSLEKKTYVSDKDADEERNWWVVVTARSSRAFVVTAIIIGIGWLGLQARKSAIVYNYPL